MFSGENSTIDSSSHGMKSVGPLKTMALLFAGALAFYAIAYFAIEHRRNRNGPWEVAFTNNLSGTPALLINQHALAITNFQITFPGAAPSPDFHGKTIRFDHPTPVPYAVPYGQCVFMDTTFLPGTIALQVFGHEIQLLPRALTLDQQERAWRSNETITVQPTNTVAGSPTRTVQ